MAKTTELERLVVKLVGDASHYAKTMLQTVPKITQQGLNQVRNLISKAALAPVMAKQFAQNFTLGFSRAMAGSLTPLRTWAGRAGHYVGAVFQKALIAPTLAKQFGQNLWTGIQRGWTGNLRPLTTLAGRMGRALGFGLHPANIQWGIRQGVSSLVMGSKRAAQNFALGMSRVWTGGNIGLRTAAGRFGVWTMQSMLAAPAAIRRGIGNLGIGLRTGFLSGGATTMRTGMGQLGEVAGRGARFGGMGLGMGAMAGARAVRGAGGLAMGGLAFAGRAAGSIGGAAGSMMGSFGKALASIRAQGGSVFDFLSYRVRRLGYDFQSVGRQLVFYLTLPIVGMGLGAVKAFARFDDAMQTSIALVGGVSDRVRKEMEETVFSISRASRTGPTEAALGYYHLASAGYKAADAMKVIGTVEKFAVAGAFDLSESGGAASNSLAAMSKATNYLVDIQAALGKRVADTTQNMINMRQIGDVLTQANIIANATVSDFAEALTNKGAAAIRLMNKDLEEGVAVLAAYAAQGVKGSAAGERLYIITRDLQRAAIKNSAEWRRLGIAVYDSAGKMLNLSSIVQMMERVLGPMSDQMKRATLMNLGLQDRSLAATIQLLGMGKSIEEYERQLRSAGGVMEEVADIRLASFASQMMMMRNQITIVAIGIGKLLVPFIMRMNEGLRDAIEYWNSLSEPARRWIVVALAATAAIGPLMLATGILVVGFEAMASSVRVVGSVFWAFLKPVRVAINTVFILTRMLLELAAAAAMAAAKIAIDLAVSIGRLLMSALVAAASTVVNLIGAVVSLTAIAGPLGALAAVLGAVAGFALSAGLAVSGIVAAVQMIGAGVGVVAVGFSSVFAWIVSSAQAAGNFLLSIRGPKGIVGALGDATAGAVSFGKNSIKAIRELGEAFVGFMENYTANMTTLWDWLEANWNQVWSEITKAGTIAYNNMSQNIEQILGAMSEAVGPILNYLSVKFENLWIDFTDFAKRALLLTANLTVEWATRTAAVMATAFSSNAIDKAMASVARGKMIADLMIPGIKKAEPEIAKELAGIFERLRTNLKAPGANIALDLPELPKFVYDIAKPSEDAAASIASVTDTFNKAKTDIEGRGPITAGFQLRGVEGVIVGTAAAMRELMAFRAYAMGVTGEGAAAVEGTTRPGRISAADRTTKAHERFMAKHAKTPKFIGDAFTKMAERDAKMLEGEPTPFHMRGDVEAVAGVESMGVPGALGTPESELVDALHALTEAIHINTDTVEGNPTIELEPADLAGG